MALARFRNTETDEVVELNADWLERWPDDPYERLDDAAETPAPARADAPVPAGKQPAAAGDEPTRGRF